MINKNIFFFYFFLFNAWHVTKQSLGICKLYSKDKFEINFQRNIIFLFNFFIVLFGSCLFLMLKIISEAYARNLGIVFITLSLMVFIIQTKKFKNFENSFITLTGILIFIPSFFVTKPIHALLAGVTMHYSQYIGITLKLYSSKKKVKITNLKNIQKNFYAIKKYFIWILFYRTISTFLTFLGGSNYSLLSNLFIISILGQIIHFYLDGLVWKFKDPKIKSINLRYLF